MLENKEYIAIVSLLDEADEEIRSHIEKKILDIGIPMIPYLEAAWEEAIMPDLQEKIEDILHIIQLEVLKERLHTWLCNEGEDLLEGLWIIATYMYPDIEFEVIKNKFEQLYYEVWSEFKGEMKAHEKIRIINNVLFNKFKFRANTANIHAPSNSILSHVMDTKKGNPLSICVIYLLIAQKLNMPIYGVNLPNLFILLYEDADTQFYINAYNRGTRFNLGDILNYLEELNIAPKSEYYRPCDHIEIIMRVMRNLSFSYHHIGDYDKEKEVYDILMWFKNEAINIKQQNG